MRFKWRQVAIPTRFVDGSPAICFADEAIGSGLGIGLGMMDPETWNRSKEWKVVHINTGLAVVSKDIKSRRAAISRLRRCLDVLKEPEQKELIDAASKALKEGELL